MRNLFFFISSSSEEEKLEFVRYLRNPKHFIEIEESKSKRNFLLAVKYYVLTTKKRNEKYEETIAGLLWNATGRGNLNSTKYLINVGADIHSYGGLPLEMAVDNSQLKIVKYLLEHGSNVHERGDNIIISAVLAEDINVINYLIDKGADIHLRNEEPLITAVEFGLLGIVKYLIEEKGADSHAQNDKIFHLIKKGNIIQYDKKKVEEMIEYLEKL